VYEKPKHRRKSYNMRLFLLFPPLLFCSCSTVMDLATADNILRAVEIGENLSDVYKDGLAIYETTKEPRFSEPVK